VCPSYTLHHLVRERYPRFVDALSDLDDALTLTYLFAALPSTTAIKAKMGGKAKRLAAAWGAYCSTAGCITKSFISVKGVYLEATIRGVPVRWVVPHSFTQFMPDDVDYKVMATFFEFYETLLNFVLFKLYSDLGVRYPLSETEGGTEVKGNTTFILAANLRSLNNAMTSTDGAITNVISDSLEDEETKGKKESRDKTSEEKKKDRELIKTVGAALDNIQEDDNEMDDDEEKGVDIAGPLKVALESMEEDKVRSSIPAEETQLDDEAMKRRRLFAGFTFYLSREVPRGYLELISLAFGAKVGWEGANSPIGATDPSITHHIVDRPQLLSSYDSLPKSREFVQPQWILDCTNFMFLLPIDKYGVGKSLPPHLSPWVDNDEEGYKPAYAEVIEKLKRGEVVDEDAKEDDDSIVVDAIEEDEPEVVDEAEESDGESEEESNEEDKKKEIKKKKARAKKRREQEEKEAHELAKSMMSRKASHLYGRMQHGISKKEDKIQKLEDRRREPLQNKEKDDDGKSMLKQKVERLKRERKKLEDEYKDTGGSMKKNRKKRRST
jgi:pescadillo protein